MEEKYRREHTHALILAGGLLNGIIIFVCLLFYATMTIVVMDKQKNLESLKLVEQQLIKQLQELK